MELVTEIRLMRQLGVDVAYGNIRRQNNTLKIVVPPGTMPGTMRQQVNGVVTSELSFKVSSAKGVITTDPPNTCRPKLGAPHPLLMEPEDADVSRYPTFPRENATGASMRISSSCSLLGRRWRFTSTSYNFRMFSPCSNELSIAARN
jgi:hypothetical protein